MVIHIVSSNIGMNGYMVYDYYKFGLVHTMAFLWDFVFKNRLIRLGFPKNKTHNLLIPSQASESLHYRVNCDRETQKKFSVMILVDFT